METRESLGWTGGWGLIWAARALLLADVLLSTVYVFSLSFTVPRLLGPALAALAFFRGTGRIPPSTVGLMTWTFALVFYKFLLDSTLHLEEGLDAATQLLKESVTVLMLPVFERIGAGRIRVVSVIMVAATISGAFGFIQIFYPGFNIPSLLPSNPILITDGDAFDYIASENRIVGTYAIAIGFALLMGLAIVILWARNLILKKNSILTISALLVAVLFAYLILASQTRSAVYGLFPALLMAYLIENLKNPRKMMLAIGVAFMLLVAFDGYREMVSNYSSRSAKGMDANTYYKITANLYGTYAALARDPLFGVPIIRSDPVAASKAYYELIVEGRAELGEVIEDSHFNQDFVPTNHNLFAFYARYYGLVGFFLLIGVLVMMFRKARRKKDISDRYLIYGVIIYFLQYSLLHNTQILETLAIWALLSVGKEDDSRYGFDERL